MERPRGVSDPRLAVVTVSRMHGEDPDRPLDVLHLVLAQVLERAGRLSRNLVAHRERDRDAADGSERLQACGDVHAFAVDVVAVDDDIAEIDADPIANALRFGHVRLGARRGLLDRQRTVDGRDHTPEFDERAVADELYDAPAVSGDAGSKIRLR